MSIFRDPEVMQILERHPLKRSLARGLDEAEIFEEDVKYLPLNTDLSPQGRQNDMQKKLRAAIRENRVARGPVNDLKAKRDAKCALVQRPSLDQSQAARDDRREARLIMRGMVDPGKRALLLSGAGADPDFQDAMLERKPIFSGLMPEEQFIVDAARTERLAGLFPAEHAEIAELESTIAEADSILDRALVHLKLHSGMGDRVFIEFSTPILSGKNEVWVTSDRKQVVEISDGKATYRPASVDEAGHGRVFTPEAYAADRAA
jgi:hypothetical protein